MATAPTPGPPVDPPVDPPDLDAVKALAERLAPHIVQTPVVRWAGPDADAAFGADTTVWAKLELFQVAGTFKPRGTLANLMALDDAARAHGVTTYSAGNHAISVAYAARAMGISAKVCVPRTVNRYRLDRCRELGADPVLTDDVHAAWQAALDLVDREGRTMIHPFEGPNVAAGTGTVGLELVRQVPDMDAMVVAIGGGGLAGGLSSVVKRLKPEVEIFGVEPVGAATMHRSVAAGSPQPIDAIRTIADSLGAPRAEPYSYGLCRTFVDELALIDDAAIIEAMRLIYRALKLAVEPACAASVAALAGPLRDRLAGRRVAVILCGTNIGPADFARLVG